MCCTTLLQYGTILQYCYKIIQYCTGWCNIYICNDVLYYNIIQDGAVCLFVCGQEDISQSNSLNEIQSRVRIICRFSTGKNQQFARLRHTWSSKESGGRNFSRLRSSPSSGGDDTVFTNPCWCSAVEPVLLSTEGRQEDVGSLSKHWSLILSERQYSLDTYFICVCVCVCIKNCKFASPSRVRGCITVSHWQAEWA